MGALSLMNLLIARAWSALIPALIVTSWRTVPLAASSTLPVVERLQRDLAADQLLLENLEHRFQAVLSGRAQRQFVTGQLDARARPLEVEPGL